MNENHLIMASDVAKYLINAISTYGDLPCVLEHHSSNPNDVPIEPLKDLLVMTIYQSGSTHTEHCIVFMNRSIVETQEST